MNLDHIRAEMEGYLRSKGIVVFHGLIRHQDLGSVVLWDSQRHPDFREFVDAAQSLGIKLMVLSAVAFDRSMVEDALDRLEECDLEPEERRRLQKQVRDFARYEGFLCSLDLMFDYNGRTYVHDIQADWYLDYLRLSNLIDDLIPSEEEDEDEDSDFSDDYYHRN